MNHVEPIRSPKHLNQMKKVLSRDPRNLAMFILGINTGLRISDILNLKVADISSGGEIKSHFVVKQKKTGKTVRLPLGEVVQASLSGYVDECHPDYYLFVSAKGGRLSRVQFYRIIREAADEVGITDRIGTHTLRKTFGYHHYQRFKDVALLQQIFGHSSPSVTLRYIGITQDEIDNSIYALNL